MTDTILMLRTCDARMRSRRGLVWPASWPVECADWDPTPRCGHGLHGLPGGVGYGGCLDWRPTARWLVFEARADELVRINGDSAKAPRGNVVYCGNRLGAVQYLVDRGCSGLIVGATVTVGCHRTAVAGYHGTARAGDVGEAIAGYHGTAIAGDFGQATAGDRGQATVGNYGKAVAGNHGKATAGRGGKATAGIGGTAVAGDYGTATAEYQGEAAAGEHGQIAIEHYEDRRPRLAVGYVGENGIEPDVLYRVEDGRLVPAKAQP